MILARPKFKIGALGFGHLTSVADGIAQWSHDRNEALEFDSEVEPKLLISVMAEDPESKMPRHAGVYVERRDRDADGD